jgi:hypothetical protein
MRNGLAGFGKTAIPPAPGTCSYEAPSASFRALRSSKVERPLHGPSEGIVALPRPPPPIDFDTTEPIEPIAPPSQAINEWIPDDGPDLDWFNRPRNPSNPDPDGYDQRPVWKPEEIQLDDSGILILEST